jgi:hypothetical protein
VALTVEALPPSQSPSERTEPAGTTTGDLLALAAGVALAASLEWYSGWGSQLGPWGSPAPRWYVLFYYFKEGLQKGLVALIPVVIARRVRYGGPIRTAEFLALTVGVPRLLLSFERLPALGLVVRAPGRSVHYQINADLYDRWMQTELFLALLAVAAAVRFRERLAPWVTATLLVGFWVALAPAEGFVHQFRDAILERVHWPRWGVVVLNDVLLMPFRVFWMVPLVADVMDRLGGDRRAPTWVEAACLGLALSWFLCVRFKYYIDVYYTPLRPGSYERIVRDMIEIVAAVILGILLVQRCGPALRRWIFPAQLCGAEDRSS